MLQNCPIRESPHGWRAMACSFSSRARLSAGQWYDCGTGQSHLGLGAWPVAFDAGPSQMLLCSWVQFCGPTSWPAFGRVNASCIMYMQLSDSLSLQSEVSSIAISQWNMTYNLAPCRPGAIPPHPGNTLSPSPLDQIWKSQRPTHCATQYDTMKPYSDSSVWTNDSSHRGRNGGVLPRLVVSS